MKKHTKKIIALLALLSLILAMVGCTPSNTRTTDPEGRTVVTISYWNTEETMAPLLKYLETALPHIKVEFNYINNSVYGTSVSTKLIAGEGYDIMAQTAIDILSLSKQGLLVDLTESLAPLYTETGTSEYTVDGKVWAVPNVSWFEGYFYNKDIFEQYNIAVPTTFDEFLNVCEQLKAVGVKPLTIGAKSADTILKSLLGYVNSEYLLSDAGKDFDVKFSTGEATLSGNWDPYINEWKALIDNGIITTDMLGMDENQAMDEFATGQAAIWASGPWNYSAIKQKNVRMNFGMFPYLGKTPESASLVGGPGSGWTVNANSKVLDAALEVLQAMSTPEAQQALVSGNPGSSSYLIGVESDLPSEYDGIKDVLEAGRIYCAWNNWGIATHCFSTFTQQLQGLVAGYTNITDMLKEVDQNAANHIRANEGT